MTIVNTMRRGVQGLRASVTLDNINLSESSGSDSIRIGAGLIELVNAQKATYEQIYRQQPWVAICVNKLSRGIARLPLKSYAYEGDGRVRVREGPLPDLLARPYPGGSPFALKSAVIGNVCVYGNCVAPKLADRPGAPPSQLIPTSFAHWTVMPGEGPLGRGRPIEWYVFTSLAGQRIPFRPEEVVHFKWWGPGLDLIGASPLEPLRRTLMVEDAAQRTTIASYEHGHRPSGAWTTDAKLDQDQMDLLRKELDRVYGGVDNAFKMAILSGGVKWSPMSHTLVDAEIINTRKITRDEALAVYDLPPPAVGVLERAIQSNIEESHLMLYMDTFGPLMTMVEETIGVQLIAEEPKMDGQFVEFDLSEVLKGDVKKRFDAYAKARWWMTPNEVRQRENLPPVKDDPGADSLHVPLNEGPVGPLREAHCPSCDRVLARNVLGADLWCRHCKMQVSANGNGRLIGAAADGGRDDDD